MEQITSTDYPESIADRRRLANGIEMPWMGLGTFKMADGPEVVRAVRSALEVGYRSIDTAPSYGNENGVGRALSESAMPREEIFVTGKVWNSDQGYEPALKAFEASLATLRLDYFDLYLVHWPVEGLFLDTWRALEKLYTDGRVKAIGVSNFLIHHLRLLLPNCEVLPVINQVEFHPFLQQPDLYKYCADRNIQMEAWSPLMKGQVVSVSDIVEIADRHEKTPAQVVLRWHLQRGIITIPKSVNPDRIGENAGIFDFSLSDDDMQSIGKLDRDQRTGPHPDVFPKTEHGSRKLPS
jgi:diketogulonate reductase-like aldo/keto reductase